MSFVDNKQYNIESAQKLHIQWSPEIVWDYDDGYPTGDEDVFKWSSTYIPYRKTEDGYEVFHVWMKYKIGDIDEWSVPARINYPTVVAGEQGKQGKQGDEGDPGSRGARGKGIIVQYADKDYNIVPNNSALIKYVRLKVEGEAWSMWLQMVGSDGVGSGGIGIPAGGTVGQLIQRTATGYEWVDEDDIYNDTDAVNAMGAKADSNPLNHDRYTDAEVQALIDADALTATSPIDITAGVVSHLDTVGNKHVPGGDTANYSLIGDGAGNLSWELMLLNTQLDDSAGIGDLDKLLSANAIMSLIGSTGAYGIRYAVDHAADLAALTGMVSGDLAVCKLDTNRPVHKYDGSAWNWFFDMDATHNHNTLYTLTSDLISATVGSDVNWNRVFNKPSLIAYAGADNGLGVVSDKVELGGTLTKDTDIALDSNTLGIGTDIHTGEVAVKAYNISLESALLQLSIKDSKIDIANDSFELEISNTLAKFSDFRVVGSQTGLEYADDYSADFVDRSLIDKAYADSVAGSKVTASNGLTKTLTDIALGGILSGNTLIEVGTFSFGTSGIGKTEFLSGDSTHGYSLLSVNKSEAQFKVGDTSGIKTIVLDILSDMIVTDTKHSKGLMYAGDYRAANASNDRWLIDKEYADDTYAPIVHTHAVTNGAWQTLVFNEPAKWTGEFKYRLLYDGRLEVRANCSAGYLSAGVEDLMGTLPAPYRPSSRLKFIYYSNFEGAVGTPNTPAVLAIDTDGTIRTSDGSDWQDCYAQFTTSID